MCRDIRQKYQFFSPLYQNEAECATQVRHILVCGVTLTFIELLTFYINTDSCSSQTLSVDS